MPEEIQGDHPRKFSADAALNESVKAGEQFLSLEHLAEIEGRRALADLDILIGACKAYIAELSNYGWGPSDAPAEEASSEEPDPSSDEDEEPAS